MRFARRLIRSALALARDDVGQCRATGGPGLFASDGRKPIRIARERDAIGRATAAFGCASLRRHQLAQRLLADRMIALERELLLLRRAASASWHGASIDAGASRVLASFA
ncbi:MAG TPA: hypothetical protein VGG28_18195 [Kofleriaceae bacterium]